MRCQHPKSRLQLAKDPRMRKRRHIFLCILHQEVDKRCWQRVNRLVGKPRYGQVLSVKVDCDNGGKEEIAMKLGVYAAVKANILNRFWLVSTTPSYSGQLFDDIGFLGNTESVKYILEGTYIFPDGTDQAT